PFCCRSHDAHLIIDIFKGISPEIVKGTPEIYVNLMKSFWQSDPSKRPTSEEIGDILIYQWSVFEGNSEIYKIFKKANKEMENNIELD
ncbi:7396_t:CDS:1, partial [Dentiscutata erythropus]